MKWLQVTVGLLMVGGAAMAAPQAGKGIEGIWQGELQASVQTLRVVVRIARQPDGALTATMDSPDQGAAGIPVAGASFEGGRLTLDVAAVRGRFEGEMNPEGTEIRGKFTQAGVTLPLALRRTDKAPETRRPQDPRAPYPYTAEDVAYENAKAGVRLAGTLTYPSQGGPFPAALLISGSGPQDRNETIFGHHPFLVLADFLTRRGIAVLRVDDRGVGGSTGAFSKATSEDFASDAMAGVEFLCSRKEIRSTQIGLVGHSEGGLIAPMVADRMPGIAFLVLMAGPGMKGEELLYLQGEKIARAMGADETKVAAERALQQRLFAVVKEVTNPDAAAARVRAIVEETAASAPPDKAASVRDGLQAQAQMLLSPWFRFFLLYDPIPALRRVRCPLLAINGSLDLQVPAKENLRAIAAALKEGGSKDYRTQELPGLNHLFQKAKTGAPAEYAGIEETINQSALKAVGDWVVARTRAGITSGSRSSR